MGPGGWGGGLVAEIRGPRLQEGGRLGEAGTQRSTDEGAQERGGRDLPSWGLQAQDRCLRRWFAGTPPPLPCPAVAPQTSQAGVAVMAVAISVALLLLVVAIFYCMRRKGRPGCCQRGEKGSP